MTTYKKILLAAAAALLVSPVSFADVPFRNHRYDAINIMPVHSGDIVFVGNSITNMHEWWEAFGGKGNILNRGVSGCVSAETLANIGKVIEGHPAKVFLMVGTNDLGDRSPEVPDRVLANVEQVVAQFKAGSPETELYIQSVLPVAENNNRSAESIMKLNALYKDLCEREGITYVDLWSKMVEPGTTHINPAYTKDGLHLYPSGYRVWCNEIAPLVGADCVYQDREFNDCGLPGSFGMRAAGFDMLPLKGDDIVIFGDELIHGGEWHELLGSDKVKSRGTCWGFGGPPIETLIAELPAVFGAGEDPAQIYVHAGATEVFKNEPVDTIAVRYRKLVAAISEAAPSSKLVLMAVQPVYPAHYQIADQVEVNARIEAIAKEFNAGYIDIYTPLCKNGRGDRNFVTGNYVYGKGYLRISRLLAAEMGLDPVQVMYQTRETSFTGRGNEGEVLTTLTVSPERKLKLRKVSLTLDAEASDISRITVSRDGEVLGSTGVKPGKKSYRIRCNADIDDLADIDVCADIAEDAVEGHKLSATIDKVRFGLRWSALGAPEPGCREILLRRVKVLGAGDYGSAGYRIPAIVTLPDGTLLIATDKRKYNDADLPEDIDVIVQRSTDNGKTWSDPITVIEGQGFAKGYGDAALEVTPSGDVICVFSGGPGLWASTLENPQRNYVCRSTDGGLTWSEPYDCTPQLWGPTAPNRECRTSHSAFFASGRGLCLTKGPHAGRVMFVAAIHSKLTNRFDNYIYYSDDEGHSWNVSKCAFEGGDEAKVVELPDGKVLLSVRRRGERGYNVSEDGGVTWGEQGTWKDICVNACDGDIISVGDSLLLHSVPNDMSRRNVSIFVSRDGGKTWPHVKSICHYESVYSALTLLPDGTVGVYFEENPKVEFDMYFMNFSLDWLLDE